MREGKGEGERRRMKFDETRGRRGAEGEIRGDKEEERKRGQRIEKFDEIRGNLKNSLIDA